MIKWSGECFFFVLIDLVICLCSIHILLAHILPIFNSELFSRGRQLSKTFTSDAVVSECENQYLHFLVNYTSNIQLPFDSITSQWTFLAQELCPCLLSASGLRITPPSHHSKVIAVSVRNRMAGRRGRQNACVWQTWQGYNLHVLSWSSITFMFSGLLQKGWCLKESEVWQKVISNKIIVVNACHTRFPVLLHKFTWLNKNLCVIVSVYDNLNMLSTSVLCNLNYYENVELTGWYKTPN